jgi:hypothetical protein
MLIGVLLLAALIFIIAINRSAIKIRLLKFARWLIISDLKWKDWHREKYIKRLKQIEDKIAEIEKKR